MTDAQPYSIPKEPGRWRAFALAIVMHGLLLGVLWFSVQWQNQTPIAIEAEVWSPVASDAAPSPPPEPVAQVRQPPEPVVAPPPPVVPPPKPVVIEPPVVNPDIALALEKKRKERLQQEKQEHDQQARLEKQKELREEAKLENQKAAREAARVEKLAAEKDAARQEKLKAEKKREDKDKADALAIKRAADEQKKLADDVRAKAERSDQVQRDKARNEDLKRMMAQAGSGGSGDAPKSTGSRGDAGYLGKVAAKIRSNTIFNVPDNLAGNTPVEYAVELLPDGSIRRPIKKIKSSGVPGFDEAVLNAIEKSQPFPPDKSGSVPSSFNIVHRPKDQG